MKMNYSSLLRLVSGALLLCGLGGAVQACEVDLERGQQRELVHEALKGGLKEFKGIIQVIDTVAQQELLSRLVKAHMRAHDEWNRLILETKVDWLVNEVRGCRVTEQVKAQWYALYKRTTLKRFRALVEGLAQGSKTKLTLGVGNSPDPRQLRPGTSLAALRTHGARDTSVKLVVKPSEDEKGISWGALATGLALLSVGVWVYTFSKDPKKDLRDAPSGAVIGSYFGYGRKL